MLIILLQRSYQIKNLNALYNNKNHYRSKNECKNKTLTDTKMQKLVNYTNNFS